MEHQFLLRLRQHYRVQSAEPGRLRTRLRAAPDESGLSRDLGPRTFVILNGAVGGVYAGFLDGFLDWYNGTLGIRMDERERRPREQFLYTVTLPDGRSVSRARQN